MARTKQVRRANTSGKAPKKNLYIKVAYKAPIPIPKTKKRYFKLGSMLLWPFIIV
jgi:hypothetical protein